MKAKKRKRKRKEEKNLRTKIMKETKINSNMFKRKTFM